MTDRMLIRGGYVLTQDPTLGELVGADVLVEGDRIVAVGHGLSADGARTVDATDDIVIPGFIDTHRHTWETSIRTCAPDFALITYFGNILDKFAPHYRPDDVFAANQWGALECLNAGHHDPRRLVAHHEHAGPRRRSDPGPPGDRHPLGLCLRFPQHVAPGLVVRTRLHRQHLDQRRGRGPPDPGPVLQLERRPDHDVPGHPRAGLLQAGRRQARLGPGQGARHPDHGPRGDGSLRLHEAPGQGTPGHEPAPAGHDLRPWVALHGRGVGAWSASPAATSRSPPRSRSRWATAGRRRSRRRPTTSRSGCPPTWPPRPRRTSSPRCTRSSARSGDASTRRPGRPTSTGSRRRPG